MELCDFILKMGSGKNTRLDDEYSKLINEIIFKSNEEQEERWETYNLIIKELLEIDNGNSFAEIKYRLTDGESPNDVILDLVSRYDSNELTYLAYHLSRRVEEYAEEDLFKRFYE